MVLSDLTMTTAWKFVTDYYILEITCTVRVVQYRAILRSRWVLTVDLHGVYLSLVPFRQI